MVLHTTYISARGQRAGFRQFRRPVYEFDMDGKVTLEACLPWSGECGRLAWQWRILAFARLSVLLAHESGSRGASGLYVLS